MPRSLGLAAYLAFARRQPSLLGAIQHPRPTGELIWLHCASPKNARTLAKLGRRLARLRDETHILLTAPPGVPFPQSLPKSVIWQNCPTENAADIELFLNHWQPDMLLWLGPELRPALISATKLRRIPKLLLQANHPKIDQKRRWGPEPLRGTLSLFDTVFAEGTEAKNRLSKLLPDTSDIQLSGELMEESAALPVADSDLEDLRAALLGRPVWLAARLQPQELPTVLASYRAVLRLSFRTLLVVVPDLADDADAMRDAITAEGWRMADWDAGAFPEEDTQVIFTHSPEELGLWYRVAPVSFLGSSLQSGAGGRDPLEAAALGSAILYGPSVRRYLNSYSRLANAGAARIVKDAESLTAALVSLAAPDQVAAMAHAGWQVVSDSAEVSDKIIEHANELLDARKANS